MKIFVFTDIFLYQSTNVYNGFKIISFYTFKSQVFHENLLIFMRDFCSYLIFRLQLHCLYCFFIAHSFQNMHIFLQDYFEILNLIAELQQLAQRSKIFSSQNYYIDNISYQTVSKNKSRLNFKYSKQINSTVVVQYINLKNKKKTLY